MDGPSIGSVVGRLRPSGEGRDWTARWKRALASGALATVGMVGTLLVAEAAARFGINAGRTIAGYLGFGFAPLLGTLLFVFTGVVVWPLLFVHLEVYFDWLPGPFGRDPALKGALYGVPLWVVFVASGTFLGGVRLSGLMLALHLLFTLGAHLMYGYTLGAVYHVLEVRAEGPGTRQ